MWSGAPIGEAPPQEDFRPYNTFWQDRGDSNGRTSLIVDPADGRLPPRTPEAQRRPRPPGRDGTDSWEDRSLEERCVYHSKAGPPLRPGAYNNTVQIVQTPGHVALLIESIHDTRVIPLDERPPLGRRSCACGWATRAAGGKGRRSSSRRRISRIGPPTRDRRKRCG